MSPSVLFVIALVVAVNGCEFKRLTKAEFDGLVMYIEVDNATVQSKLDDFHSKRFPDASSLRRLSLPDVRPFPELIDEGKHVIFIGIGETTDLDFHPHDYEGTTLVTKWIEMGVTIPFLTDGVDTVPEYALALGSFYQRSEFEVANPNFAFPQFAVDHIALTDDGFEIRNGSETMRLKLTRYVDPCEPVSATVRHEFQQFMSTVKQIGAETPYFGICENHSNSVTPLCSAVDIIGENVMSAAPNFCQTAWSSERRENCNAKVEEDEISDWFREFLLLGDGDVNIVEDETIHGNFTIGLKYPCLGQA